ncbi:MAG: ModE family transcriptional regulator, partial [Comamonadaceae bacterium]
GTGRIVRVRMLLPDGAGLSARITQESAELLGLAEGMTAIGLCKATAVKVERADATSRRAGNRLTGTIARVARGDSGDEVVVALAGGELQLVGFAPSGSALRTRQRVTAQVDEAAVVVALPG